jgi:Tol biopolymer transport system component
MAALARRCDIGRVRTRSDRKWVAWTLAGVVSSTALVAVAVAAPRVASAAFAGRNGRIGYVTEDDWGVVSVRPGGGGDRILADPPSGYVTWFAYKPDGRQIVFTWARSHGGQLTGPLYLKRADGRGRSRRLTRPFDPRGRIGDDVSPSWSPDGQSLVFERGYSVEPRDKPLRKAPPRSGLCAGADECIRIYHRGRSRPLARDAWGPVWSTRGLIAFKREDGIWVIRPDGSDERRLVGDPELDPEDWSPDGRRLLLTDENGELAAVGVDGRNLHHLRREAFDPAYSPDGRRIVYFESDSTLVTINVRGGSRRKVRTFYCCSGSPDWQPLPRRRHHR